MAKSGVVNVLCGAPYGYNYIRKTEDTAAYYEINQAEALVVQSVFKWYAEDFLSIGAITRELNEQKVPTRKRISKCISSKRKCTAIRSIFYNIIRGGKTYSYGWSH